MAIKKSELLSALKADLKASDTLRTEWFNKIAEWRNETVGKEYGNEVKGKSRIVSKDIKKQLDWMLPTLADPFLSTSDIIKCSPITYEDVLSARQNELILNTQFCRKFPRYNFLMKALKVLATEGTLVVQTGWDYEDEEIETMSESVMIDEITGEEDIVMTKQKTVRIKKNQPTATVCRNEDIYIDPTCMDDMDKCQFVIHRYETDLSTLKADGRYKNLEKVAATEGSEKDYGFYPQDHTYFDFKDKARKKMVVYEYWGNYDVNEDGVAEPIVCAWIGNTIIRLQSNPYPDNKPPFLVVPFNSVPFQMHGESLASVIGDNQKVKTAIIRGIMDNMANSNNGQLGMRKGALDITNRKKFLEGKNFEYNGSPNDFWQGSYNQIPSSAFDVLTIMNNEIESQTGVKSFSGGITGNSLGNMLDIATPIPLIDGTVKVLEDIVDGDLIVGSNGKATKVLKAHEIKYPKAAFDIVFSNGDTIKSGAEHLWTVKIDSGSSKGSWHTVDTDTLMKYFNTYSNPDTRTVNKRRGIYIPRIKRVDNGKEWDLDIDPYQLGYWLGDGNTNEGKITTADLEVVEYFKESGYDLKPEAQTGKAFVYRINKGEAESTFTSKLAKLGLSSRYSKITKFIPEEVFSMGYYAKLEVIRGLVDSDGFIHNEESGTGFAQICQSESQLKDDIIRLLKSMGCDVKVSSVSAELQNKRKEKSIENGALNIVSRKTTYKIGFSMFDCPARLPRKASRWVMPKFKNTYSITDMKEVDNNTLMRCLTVDSDDKLYACGDNYTLTHNTATGVSRVLDATATRRISLVRNIAENLIKPLMRKWMAYNYEFLEDEEVVRITNEEFVPVRRDDLYGNIDIEISISTAEDNSAKSQELSFLLQTMGPNQDFEINKLLMGEIARLSRMPDLEKKIREHQPQQDPAAEQMKQIEIERMQLENEKIKADIKDKLARAGENEVDRIVKMNKAKKDDAAARKISSEADKLDLEFLMKNDGVDVRAKQEDENNKYLRNREAKIADNEAKRLNDLDRLAIQHMLKKKEGK